MGSVVRYARLDSLRQAFVGLLGSRSNICDRYSLTSTPDEQRTLSQVRFGSTVLAHTSYLASSLDCSVLSSTRAVVRGPREGAGCIRILLDGALTTVRPISHWPLRLALCSRPCATLINSATSSSIDVSSTDGRASSHVIPAYHVYRSRLSPVINKGFSAKSGRGRWA